MSSAALVGPGTMSSVLGSLCLAISAAGSGQSAVGETMQHLASSSASSGSAAGSTPIKLKADGAATLSILPLPLGCGWSNPPYQRDPAESLKTDDDALLAAAVVDDSQSVLSASDPCDVTHYGALGDNHTEATSAFQAAIAACVGRTRGAVVVPAGTYLLRPVELFSHTTFVIEPGATLVAWSGVGWKAGWPNSTSATCTASPYESKIPVVLPQLESLLYVDGVTNVTINGGGSLDGQGWRWWPLRDKSEYWHHCKPSLIRLGGGNSTTTSSHLTVDNLALHNSPHFNIQAWTDYTRYTRLNFTADTCPLNTDSLHVGGWNVYIGDCNVHSGDDCVPISKYSENVLVERVRCSAVMGHRPSSGERRTTKTRTSETLPSVI